MKKILSLTIILLLLSTSIVLYINNDKKETQLIDRTENFAGVISSTTIQKYNYLKEFNEKIVLISEIHTDSERSLYYDHLLTLINVIIIHDSNLHDLISYMNEDFVIHEYNEQVSNLNNSLLLMINEKNELKLQRSSIIIEKYNSEIYQELLNTHPTDRYKGEILSKLSLMYKKMASELEDD